ncbi:hypothetical protein EXIGLDRAFT_763409 [Exidia glandulosa HHB12029]|uniref:F-box domain-containing protein n=1 Tax=Exidia glandulosa HHB12029 TaxID=1314781 RepID=A0A165LZT2_EXIGL|nr:hypothetical protein EXIGLDRAFT_763409 [Exidia glandulosa HHB12029]
MSAHHTSDLSSAHELALLQAALPVRSAVRTSEPAQHGADIAVETSVCETHSPATRLVPELLCLIFSQPDLSFADRILTSHVCHAWRDASLAFPATLWTRVPPTTRLDTMAPLLDRTAALGLPVDLMGVTLAATRPVRAICELLKRHMWHIRTLGLTIIDCTRSQRDDITSAQEVEAPMLRCLYWAERHSWGPIPLPTTGFFSGYAPKLERLELSAKTVKYLSSFTAFRSVRHIIVGRVDMYAEDDLWRDLISFPALTNLDFAARPLRRNAAVSFAPGVVMVPPPPTMITLPHTLVRLRIQVTSMSQLSVLDMDHISSVCVARLAHSTRFMDDADGVVGLLVHLSPAHILPVRAEMEMILDASSVSFRISGELTRTFLNVDADIIDHPSFWESRFGIVTSLTLYMSTDFQERDAIATPCPNVEHLTVVRVKHLDVKFPDIGLTFPNLRTLALALVPDSSHSLVFTDEITTFIGSLGYEAPKLETLCFHGTSAPVHSDAFHGLAEEVRFDEDKSVPFPNLWGDM